ncbi:MAG: Fis family transcriptional regulator, partial [Nitrospirota bacterium]
MTAIRNRIETWFKNFGLLISRRPWLFLLCSVLAVAAMTFQLPNIRMDTSAEGLLHKQDPSLKTYEAFREQFGRDQMVIIGLNPPEVFNSQFLGKLRDFHNALEQEVPYMDEVTSLINAEHMHGEGDDLIVEDLLESWPQTAAEMQG